jgi:outer membrane protein insertion porin family
MLLICFLLILTWTSYLSQDLAYGEDFQGKSIQAVEIDCVEDPILKENLLSHITLSPGEFFSPEKIRENLREIYKIGDFSQVYVYVAPIHSENMPGSLKLIFCPVVKWTVSSVKISGNQILSLEEIAPEEIFPTGDKFSKERLQKLQEHIQDLYKDRGYYHAKVTFTTRVDEKTHRVEVEFEIIEGSPSQIGQITFVGNTVFNRSKLYQELGLKEGETYSKSKLERGFQRIRDLYLKEGYFLVKVTELKKTLESATNQHAGSQKIDLTIQIMEGDQVVFVEDGKTVRPDKILKKEFMERIQSYDPDELEQIAGAVRDYYKSRGYYLVEVRWSRAEVGGARVIGAEEAKTESNRIIFLINKRHKIAVEEISFEGNQAFSDKILKDLMRTKSKSLLSKGRYDDNTFQEDLRVIKNFYIRHGYLNANVQVQSFKLTQDQKGLLISLFISEGVQSIVKRIEFRGNTLFTSQELLKKISLKLDTPVNPDQIRDSASTIQSLYAQRGHIKARVEPLTEFSPDRTEATVTFVITEGDTYYLGDITITGLKDTRKRLVERELLIHEGDVYNPEKIRKTVRNILKLGIYSQVQFEPQEPDSEDPIQDMILSVTEAKTKSVEFALGYGTETGFNGSAELLDRNLLGYGGRGSFRVTAGLKTLKFFINYLQPRFFDPHLDLLGRFFDDLDETMTSFDIRRRGGEITLEYNFSDITRADLGYNFTHADLLSVRKDAILDPTLDRGVTDIGRLIFRISRDNRNNLLNPTRGSFHVIQTDLALGFLDSQTDFIKVTGQTSWYFPLLKRNILAFSLRGGVADPLGDSSEIPIFERFFAGGDNSIRGFEPQTVGPLGTADSPIGGDTYLVFNGELRFPLYRFIGGVLFFDAGNVWLRNRNFDLPDLRYTAGTGLRFSTPVGLLRVEYGFKLNRLPNESPGAWHITIGLPF